MSNVYTEIQNIANLLVKKRICKDVSPLIKINGARNQDFIQVDKLLFNIKPAPRNTRPIVEYLEILLNVTVPIVSFDNTNLNLNRYFFSIDISAYNKNGEKVKSSWHLDYDDSKDVEYVHPFFHLTFGGKMMENIEIGNLLLLPTPRFAYPPMDVILGIDFILSNFLKKDIYNEFTSDSQYRSAVKNAQFKFWRPYMLSLAHFWCKNQCEIYNYDLAQSLNLYPNLLM